MKFPFLLLVSILGISLLVSCSDKKESSNLSNTSSDSSKNQKENKFSFVGRQVKIEYPDMKADMTYSSDSTLHWQTTGADGLIEEGDENVIYKQIGDSLLFISWIEKDGITVSQAVDFKNKVVSAFLSMYDENSLRGKRTGILLEGKITN